MLLLKTYVVFIVNDKRFLSFTIVYGVLTDVILSQEIGSATAFDLIFRRSGKRRIEPVLIKKSAVALVSCKRHRDNPGCRLYNLVYTYLIDT